MCVLGTLYVGIAINIRWVRTYDTSIVVNISWFRPMMQVCNWSKIPMWVRSCYIGIAVREDYFFYVY
jgi:hypothetical protein